MRVKYYIFISVCFCFALKASGQQLFTLKGVTSKKLSGERIAQVLITDLNSKVVMMSDELGWFSIKASVGDTLLFSKYDYTDQKITVISGADIPVYMQPVVHLAEVQIAGESKKQELRDIMNDYRHKGIYFDGKPPITAFIPFGGSPITGLYELFGKEPARMRRFAAFSKSENEYAEVRKRYNIALVKRVTHASDSAAKKFMEYYTPSYEDIKAWNDYELIKHTQEEFSFYSKSTDKQGLQNLNSPLLTPQKKKSSKF
jgi:hypothetical protein